MLPVRIQACTQARLYADMLPVCCRDYSSLQAPRDQPLGRQEQNRFRAPPECVRGGTTSGKHILAAREIGSAPDGRTDGPLALEAANSPASFSTRVRSRARADSRVQKCGLWKRTFSIYWHTLASQWIIKKPNAIKWLAVYVFKATENAFKLVWCTDMQNCLISRNNEIT